MAERRDGNLHMGMQPKDNGALEAGSIQSPPSTLGDINHAVFLGTHDADPYRKRIEGWLAAMDLSGSVLVVADNCSKDSTRTWIKPLLESLDTRHLFLTNKSNLGGYGSLASNLGILGKYDWITTLHQDDSYHSDHVQQHRRLIKSADPELGMIFSSSRSFDSDGRRIFYPRGYWLLEEEGKPATVFLAHLRHHCFPFSGATFRTQVFQNYPVPLDSVAFPDTEIVMKMSPRFRAVNAGGKSVEYLENPISESHAINLLEREAGAYEALVRVFNHPSFGEICGQIPPSEIEFFIKALKSGIRLRIGNQELSYELERLALGKVLEFQKSDSGNYSELAEGHLQTKESRVLEAHNKRVTTSGRGPEAFGAPRIQKKNNIHSALKLLSPILGFLPDALWKRFFVLLMKTRVGKNLIPQFDFYWNR